MPEIWLSLSFTMHFSMKSGKLGGLPASQILVPENECNHLIFQEL